MERIELRSKEKGSGTQRVADLNKSAHAIKRVFLSPSFEQNTRRRAYEDDMRRKAKAKEDEEKRKKMESGKTKQAQPPPRESQPPPKIQVPSKNEISTPAAANRIPPEKQATIDSQSPIQERVSTHESAAVRMTGVLASIVDGANVVERRNVEVPVSRVEDTTCRGTSGCVMDKGHEAQKDGEMGSTMVLGMQDVVRTGKEVDESVMADKGAGGDKSTENMNRLRNNGTGNLGTGNTTRNTITESRVAGSDNEIENLAVGNTTRVENEDGSRLMINVEENRDGSRNVMEGRTPRDGMVVGSGLAEEAQLPGEVPRNLNPPEVDVGAAIGSMADLLSSRQIIEHHLAFAEECVSKSIYPLGLKTFVP